MVSQVIRRADESVACRRHAALWRAVLVVTTLVAVAVMGLTTPARGQSDTRIVVQLLPGTTQPFSEVVSDLNGVIVDTLDNVPVVVVDGIDPDILKRLAHVASVEANTRVRSQLDSALPAMGADRASLDAVVTDGSATGTGSVVVVIDDGVDRDHPFLADGDGNSRVVAEACFISPDPDYGIPDTECGGATSSEGEGAAAHFSGDQHGTHVAGIVAGDGQSEASAPTSGVAPGASLAAVKIFDSLGFASSIDINRALDWVITRVEGGLNVTSINLSLGTDTTYPSTCDTTHASTAALVAELSALDVVTVVSSGNEFQTQRLSFPACLSGVIPVTSVTDGGAISSFSNVSEGLAVRGFAAPGSSITSSVPSTDGGKSFGYETWSGTSMAAPMVAGAIAILRSSVPSATVDQIVANMHTTATAIDDERIDGSVTGIGLIQVDRALGYSIGGRVTGEITATDGEITWPVIDTEMTMTFDPDVGNDFSSIDMPITTDDIGRYDLPVVPPGDWLITVHGFGYTALDPIAATVTVSEEIIVDATTFATVEISDMNPVSGPAAGGTSVTIAGIHLDNIESVTFDDVASTDLTIADDGLSVTVTTPAHDAGVVDVVISDASGPVSDPLEFTYVEIRRPIGGGGGGGGGVPSPVSGVLSVSGSSEAVTEVKFSFGTVRVSLSGVSSVSGTVTVAPKSGKPGTEGGGIVLPGYWLDISSTVASFEQVEVCAPYDPARLPSYRIAEDDLRLFHWSSGIRHEVTSRVDVVNHRVCGVADSLSPFAVGKLQTTRVFGDDRFETAVEISRRQFLATAPTVYVVTGEKFPDALAAGVAAAREGGPVLLTRSGSLPDVTLTEIRRLSPTQIVIVGGTAAVSAEVETSLRAAVSGVSVVRVGGADRYATAALLSQRSGLTSADTVYVGSGDGFTEILAAAAVAGRDQMPLLLVPGRAGSVPESVRAELLRLNPRNLVVVGSSPSVGSAMTSALTSMLPNASVTILGGETPYDSAIRLLDLYSPRSRLIVATGAVFADGLAGGAWAARTGTPILVIPPTGALPRSITNALALYGPTTIHVLGGPAAISLDVENQVAKFLPR